jgi:nicotinamide riboside kinase
MEKNLKQLQIIGSSEIIRIAIYGPQSTGKTTLAQQLAKYFDTEYVPEFAIKYLQDKLEKTGKTCDLSDMLPIAVGQTKLEKEGLLIANKFLFCDTNLLSIKVFSELNYNLCDPLLSSAALSHQYDLIFLTDIDAPYEKHNIPNSPIDREETFDFFKQVLIDNNKPFITISGDKESRFNKATKILNDWVEAKKMGFSSTDFVQIFELGVPLTNIQSQLENFKNGITKTVLVEPATVSKGILKLSDETFRMKADFFDANKSNYKLEKFVPASGAASRMFQFLNEFLNDFDIEHETINAYINRKKDTELSVFIVGIDKFPFFEAVYLQLKAFYPNFDQLERDYKNYYFIKHLMSSDFFDFASKPKGVLPFHRYQTFVATALEEHLNESVDYCSSNGSSNLHFTVSESHKAMFEAIANERTPKIEKEKATKINISYSFQNKSTDTIAVDLKNKPFRDKNGRLFFRPGGHGALIENLNNRNADIMFVKNIDNVVQNRITSIASNKKALGGILIELQQKVFQYLKEIENNLELNLDQIVAFATNELNIKLQDNFSKYTIEYQLSYLKSVLDRPIRICGMVKNEGEPGGGPFWVTDAKGNSTLQIVESSQVDIDNPKQAKILSSATHFNPVDLVCGIRNYKNEKFDLTQYVDPTCGFIVQKNLGGRPVKSYELPGLWNGAMANWITVFVEVPLTTFNPVKTVNDLLKPPHQPQ